MSTAKAEMKIFVPTCVHVETFSAITVARRVGRGLGKPRVQRSLFVVPSLHDIQSPNSTTGECAQHRVCSGMGAGVEGVCRPWNATTIRAVILAVRNTG